MGRKHRLAGNTLPTTSGFTEGSEKGFILRAFPFYKHRGGKLKTMLNKIKNLMKEHQKLNYLNSLPVSLCYSPFPKVSKFTVIEDTCWKIRSFKFQQD